VSSRMLVRRDGPICTLTMNRPGVMNAFDLEMLHEFIGALDRISVDDGVRVVILEGAGGHFSAGMDVTVLHEGRDAPHCLAAMKQWSRLILSLRGLRRPLVCKVRGVAYGVGANIALAGDITLAAEGARFCQVFVHIGVLPDGGGTYFLPRRVGLAKARELAMLGEEVDGRRAAAMGLIRGAVPDEDLDCEVESLARQLLRRPRPATAVAFEGLE
jgi:2-(1,2-epoxy-1,2-dihydrophenyl)acetyl-CoA isomerase